jgi:class 3 adenylate cyclase/predicted alpha/beta hydrolase
VALTLRTVGAVPPIRYARSGDVHIAYQVLGQGPPDLVWVWGTLSHIELFWETPTGPWFYERLASFCRLITLDKRGTGMSDRVGPQPTLEERMDDVRAVMDAAESERAVIVGESEGGPMAMLFAATYPERTAALVLYGAFAKWVDDNFPGALTPAEFDRTVTDIVDHWGEGRLFNWFLPSLAGLDALAELSARWERLATTPGGFRDLMAMNRQLDARPILPTISVPTLVLHRRDDGVVSVEQGRYLAANIAGARYVELEGADHLPNSGDIEAVLGEIEEFVTGMRGGHSSDRVLVTVLFTDIVSSTEQLTAQGDQRWKSLLNAHHRVLHEHIARFGGRRVNTTGDGIIATFDGPGRAIKCACAVRDAVRTFGIELRAGLHTGEIEQRGDDVSGIAVHLAARIMSKASPGEVLVSRTVADLVAGSSVSFEDRGVHELKGVANQWQLLAVTV